MNMNKSMLLKPTHDRTAGPFAGTGLEHYNVKKIALTIGATPWPCKFEERKNKQPKTNQWLILDTKVHVIR